MYVFCLLVYFCSQQLFCVKIGHETLWLKSHKFNWKIKIFQTLTSLKPSSSVDETTAKYREWMSTITTKTQPRRSIFVPKIYCFDQHYNDYCFFLLSQNAWGSLLGGLLYLLSEKFPSFSCSPLLWWEFVVPSKCTSQVRVWHAQRWIVIIPFIVRF